MSKPDEVIHVGWDMDVIAKAGEIMKGFTVWMVLHKDELSEVLAA